MLKEAFEEDPSLSNRCQRLTDLAQKTGLPDKSIYDWFNQQRSSVKKKAEAAQSVNAAS